MPRYYSSSRNRTRVGHARIPKIVIYNHQTGGKLYTAPYSIHTRRFEAQYPTTLSQSISQQEFGNLMTFLTQKWNNEVTEKQKQVQMYVLYMFLGLFLCMFILFFFMMFLMIGFMVGIFVIQGKVMKIFNDGVASMNTYLNEINTKTFQQRGILFKLEFDVATTINGVPINDGVQQAQVNNMQSQMAMQQQIIQQQQNQISMQQNVVVQQQPLMKQQSAMVPTFQQPQNQMK